MTSRLVQGKGRRQKGRRQKAKEAETDSLAEAAPPTQAQVASVVLAGLQHLQLQQQQRLQQQQQWGSSNEVSFGQPFVAVKLAALQRHSQRGCVKSSGQTQRRRTWNEATWKGSRNALTVCLGIGVACSLSPPRLPPLCPLAVSCCLSVCPTVRLRLTVSVKEPASVILMAARLLPFFLFHFLLLFLSFLPLANQ